MTVFLTFSHLDYMSPNQKSLHKRMVALKKSETKRRTYKVI